MIDLKYSLIIEATEDLNFFSFFSPDLKGFTGVGHSIEDCLYKAKWGMEEHIETMSELGLSIPDTNRKAKIVRKPGKRLPQNTTDTYSGVNSSRKATSSIVYKRKSGRVTMVGKRNEKTSKAVGTKASKLLRSKTSSETVKSVAGSALTQRPDKKRKRRSK